MSKRPVVLMVLDGYGLNDNPEGNAIAMAKTPVMDNLMKDYPFVKGAAIATNYRATMQYWYNVGTKAAKTGEDKYYYVKRNMRNA